MILGCYYRCPVAVEEADESYPRFFVLAQVIEYNELADAARVAMHDLLGSKIYYSDIMKNDVFRAPDLVRCEAMPGGAVESIWGRGKIVSRIPSQSENEPYWYYIVLPDGSYRKVCETELKIEYSQMNFSPVLQLKNYEFQHPTWFLNHLRVSRNLHLVNNATYGFKTLAGCRAYLLPHQISTVARCFESLPVRYMLADEVGLGKTVEACSILKILKNEKESLRVLIVVPSALLSQWQSELHYKYDLQAVVNDPEAPVTLFPMEELCPTSVALRMKWDLMVVDETHRLLGNNAWYHEIQRLSGTTEHLLLLSATPIQDRNEEYRRLLALLSPDQYGNMATKDFASLVTKQKRIQQSVNQQLGRLDRYDEYAEIIAEKLGDISDRLEDKALTRLVRAIDLNSEDHGLESVHQALAFICENYRLERRVIRNRRQLISEKMSPRRLEDRGYKPLTLDENYNETGAIQSTLAYLSEHGDDNEDYVQGTAIPLLGALFSSPWAFEEMLQSLGIKDPVLQESAREWMNQARNEHDLVNEALDEDPDLIKGRLMQAMDFIDQETDILDDPEYKIVVFTAYNATLREFLKLFNARFQPKGITAVPFGMHMTRNGLEDSVYAFQNDPSCRAIICDETGGEGRNFQNAALVLHLDIPWNANALEQRIGRLDRLGRDPDIEVLSVVVHTTGTVEEQLFHIWKDGLKLFEQSLSGLEIITGELNERIVEALLDDYSNGLNDAFDDILEQADEMRDSVEDEQLFDIGTTLYRPLSQGIDHVLGLYAADDDNLFAKAMLGWGGQAGMQAEKPTADGLLEFRESRFSPAAARQSLFIPPDWSKYRDSAIMMRERKILGSFDRKTAALREDILFFAPGDAVYDSIISNAEGCSRGRCSAFAISGKFNYDGLIFIFNIQVPLNTLLENGIRLQTLSQFRMFLPLEQIVIPISLTDESRSIPTDQILTALFSYDSMKAEHLGKRGGARYAQSKLEQFISRTPPNRWEPLVNQCYEVAFKRAKSMMQTKSSLHLAKKEMHRIVNGYRAECIYFDRDPALADRKHEEFQAIYGALRDAAPVLDAACFLRVRTT